MAIRYSLGSLLAFGALNAIGGGYYGLSGAAGVPKAWLEGSPFSDYFIPSLSMANSKFVSILCPCCDLGRIQRCVIWPSCFSICW
jgi:hypothetical protein